MNDTLLQRMEKYLKANMEETFSVIRYFNGTESFSDLHGNYKAKTLEDSLNLFLKEKGF